MLPTLQPCHPSLCKGIFNIWPKKKIFQKYLQSSGLWILQSPIAFMTKIVIFSICESRIENIHAETSGCGCTGLAYRPAK